ncbi:MAG TPA: ATP-binding protein, partial [Bryobacteraceae bacterium]|jgi:CheY-like chemotaxis protein
VLINLLGNAIKYTKEGAVTLRVNATPEPFILTFEVEDTGVGIAPEDQVRVFDAFMQVDQPDAEKGTGLGLTITRQFVKLMGGTIDLQSTKGEGSRFRVELPVEQGKKAEASLPTADEGRIIGLKPGQPEHRILIVEDEPENWLLLQRMLQNAGFQVRVAEDGAQGVEMFRIWRPHFIWMDWRMPEMDGIEATRRIRALEGGPQVKIAAISASVFTSQQEGVLAAGADDFVRKPYRPTDIFGCMARHLGVEYVWDSAQSMPAEKAAALRPENLQALSKELRTEFSDALLHLDRRRVEEIISRVREQDLALASMLTEPASRLAYSEILDAIRSFERGSVGTAYDSA